MPLKSVKPIDSHHVQRVLELLFLRVMVPNDSIIDGYVVQHCLVLLPDFEPIGIVHPAAAQGRLSLILRNFFRCN